MSFVKNLLFPLLSFLIAAPSVAQLVPTYQANIRGNFLLIGNSLITCKDGSITNGIPCATTRSNNTGFPLSENSYVANANNEMEVNIDPANFTRNSSSATIAIPVGATVKFARLVYSYTINPGETSNPAWPLSKVKTPAGAISTLTGNLVYASNSDPIFTFKIYSADVTALVQAAGSGEYTIGDLAYSKGPGLYNVNSYWSMYVVYELPSEPFRSISYAEGLQSSVNGATATIEIGNFKAKSTAPVSAKLGIMSLEGDPSTTDGGYLFANGPCAGAVFTNISGLTVGSPDATNDAFNASMKNDATSRNPTYLNNLASDVDVLNIPNLVLPNSTKICGALQSSLQDSFSAVAVAISVEAAQPDLNLRKTVVGTLTSGVNGQYEFKVSNDGVLDTVAAVTVKDVLPAGLSFPASPAIGGTNAANWSCVVSTTSNANDTATCTSNTAIAVAAASVFTLPVSVSATASSPLVNRAKVFGGDDPGKALETSTGSIGACTQADEGLGGSGTNAGCAFESTVLTVAPTMTPVPGNALWMLILTALGLAAFGYRARRSASRMS